MLSTEEMKQILQNRINQWESCNKRTKELYDKGQALLEWASEPRKQKDMDVMLSRLSGIIAEDCKYGADHWDKVDITRYNAHATGLVQLIDDYLKEGT